MARLDELESAVKTHLSGVSEPTILRYLRRAAQQFCQDSKIWDVNIGSKEVMPDATPNLRRRIAVPSTAEGDSSFVLPDQSYLNAVSRVRYALSPSMEPKNLADSQWSYDIPTRELVLEPGAIFQTMTLHVDAILQTSASATQLPDWMAELWGEGISDYCTFEIMSMPKQEWSDPELAGVFKAKYDARVTEATTIKARKGSTQSIEVTPIPFA